MLQLFRFWPPNMAMRKREQATKRQDGHTTKDCIVCKIQGHRSDQLKCTLFQSEVESARQAKLGEKVQIKV